MEVLRSGSPRKDDLKYVTRQFKVNYKPNLSKSQLQQLVLVNFDSEEVEKSRFISILNNRKLF